MAIVSWLLILVNTASEIVAITFGSNWLISLGPNCSDIKGYLAHRSIQAVNTINSKPAIAEKDTADIIPKMTDSFNLLAFQYLQTI